MNKKILNLFPILLVVISLCLSKRAYAVDLSVSCSDGGCDITSGDKLFNETGIYPTWTVTKTLSAKNNYTENRNFGVDVKNFSGSSILDDVIKIEIREQGSLTPLYGPTSLSSWDSHGDTDLGTIPSNGAQKIYEFIASMDDVGNAYQGQEILFDLDLGFYTTGGDGSDDGGGGGTTPTAAGGGAGGGLLAGGFGGFFVPFGELLGVSVTTPEELIVSETSPAEETPKVLGVEAQECINSLWWILILFVQLVVTTILNKKIKKHKKLSAFLHILLTVIASYLIWKYFCVKWPIIISILIGLEGVYFSR